MPDGVCVTTYRTGFGGTHSGTHYSLYISMTYISVCHVCHVCHLVPTYIIILLLISMLYTVIQLNLVAHKRHTGGTHFIWWHTFHSVVNQNHGLVIAAFHSLILRNKKLFQIFFSPITQPIIRELGSFRSVFLPKHCPGAEFFCIGNRMLAIVFKMTV